MWEKLTVLKKKNELPNVQGEQPARSLSNSLGRRRPTKERDDPSSIAIG